MATTSYTDTTFSVNAVGGRTDADGVAVSDYTAEEARFFAGIFTPGYVSPTEAFQVTAQDTPDMTVRVGSGAAKIDLYVVEGQATGQGNYLVRLDVADEDVTVPAADASQARTDEVYLVVRDATYDAGTHGLPRIGYRKGDLGGAAPGPDSSWEAYALLASIAVPAAATEIDADGITDEREAARLAPSLLGVDSADPDAPVEYTGVTGSKTYDVSDVANHLRLTATGNVTLTTLTGGTDGKALTIEFVASGAARTLALSVGADNGFRFGSTIEEITATDSGAHDYVRVIYRSASSRWDVVGYSKGF